MVGLGNIGGSSVGIGVGNSLENVDEGKFSTSNILERSLVGFTIAGKEFCPHLNGWRCITVKLINRGTNFLALEASKTCKTFKQKELKTVLNNFGASWLGLSDVKNAL